MICFFLVQLVVFFKDAIKGQSVGKRIMKIKVVDENGNTANVFKCILRNTTMLILPVEVIFVLLEKKRLGDRLAKTDLKKVVQ